MGQLGDRAVLRLVADIAQVNARQLDLFVRADKREIEEIFADVYPGDWGAIREDAAAGRGA
jgi:hypothetical protein